MRNRGEIKREILRLVEAEEDPMFVDRIDTWFDLGLSDVFSRLRAWWAIRAANFTVDTDGAIWLPPSYLSMNVVIPQGGNKSLDLITTEQAAPYFTRGGSPTAYMMEGFLMTLLPIQTEPFSARCTYYSKLDPLENDDSVNFYVTEAGAALMYAGARHAALFREDANGAAVYGNAAVERIEAINGESRDARAGTGIQITRSR